MMKREPTAHVVPADRSQIVAIDDRETQAEFLRQLILPLRGHRRRARYDDVIDTTAQQHLPQDEAGLHGLAEADVIRDQQIDPGQPERFGERQELIGVEADAGAERRLEQVAVRRRRRAPGHRPQMGGENLGIVRAAPPNLLPEVVLDAAKVKLGFEHDAEAFALGIVINAGEVERAGAAPRPR
jgi:hypothetical protein